MRNRLAKLPSPAMAVAFVALIAALTGTAVALPGSNTVTTGDIKGGAVRTSDIKNNNVRGKDIRTGTLRGSDVGANTLTGSDINEASLGPVQVAGAANTANTANNANNANTVGGRTVQRVRRLVPDDTGPVTVYSRNGLNLVGSCPGNNWDFNATTTIENSSLFFWGIDTDEEGPSNPDGIGGGDFESGAFDVGTEADIDGVAGEGNADTDQGQIDYLQPNEAVGVNIQYILDEVSGGCLFVGTVIS